MRNYKKYIKDSSQFPLSLAEQIELTKMCDAVTRLDNRKAIPATSSNFSIRSKQNKNHFLVTRSGIHKRNLTPRQFIRTNLDGAPVLGVSPKLSDETLIHAMIYKNSPLINAVIHCHAPELEHIKLSQFILNYENKPKDMIGFGYLKIPGHELLKALGFANHEEDYYMPVVENNQDMLKLSNLLELNLEQDFKEHKFCAILIENHGIYCFGNSVAQAELKCEAILHLIDYLNKQ